MLVPVPVLLTLMAGSFSPPLTGVLLGVVLTGVLLGVVFVPEELLESFEGDLSVLLLLMELLPAAGAVVGLLGDETTEREPRIVIGLQRECYM